MGRRVIWEAVRISRPVRGRPIFQWLILGAIALLVLELAFQAYVKRHLGMNAPLVLDPIFPWCDSRTGIVLAALTIAIYWRISTRLTPAQSTCLVMLRPRCGIGGGAVGEPSRVEPVPPPNFNRVTLLAVDNSRSMTQRDEVWHAA
jgi:hypothetical protein